MKHNQHTYTYDLIFRSSKQKPRQINFHYIAQNSDDKKSKHVIYEGN